jgi:hypothetical protein
MNKIRTKVLAVCVLVAVMVAGHAKAYDVSECLIGCGNAFTSCCENGGSLCDYQELACEAGCESINWY